ncbi:putative integral membrane protein [Xylella fastidiosa subsp. fastidiosa GB514]|jgi:hypothetical protein|nr:putative integral membrane protein [Xylella fastidiosa subsp. fastidiosa GB514]KAF0571706.1 hypothetical protein P305_03080 [Xylella fastidiosa subsp. fastidiosa Mus-1]
MHEYMIYVRSLYLFRGDINTTVIYFMDMDRRFPGCSRFQGAGDALIKRVIMMNIRELSTSEIMQVDGAGPIKDSETGSVIGTVIGYAAAGTVAGASRLGLFGGAIGFSWGLGWGIGRYIGQRLMDSQTIQ